MRFVNLPPWKRAVVGAMVLLGLLGVYDAASNLPVVSGCAFYADCPIDLPPDPPG